MHMFTAKGHAWSGSAQESVLRRGGASVASLGLVILVATIMLLPPIPPSGDSILPAPSRCDEDVDEAIAQSKGLEGAMGHPLAGPSGFLENRGQLTDPLVRFYTTTAPVAAGFTPAGVRFLLRDTVENGPGPSPTGCDGTVPGITYQLTFGNAEPVEPEGMGALQIPTRVYSGQYRGIRLDDVASFSEIIYQSIYPGIDLRFYFNGGRLKYEFKVGPGADAGRVLLTYEGVSDLAVEPCSGDLLIDVDGHQVRDERPVIIQESPQGRLSIPSSFM